MKNGSLTSTYLQLQGSVVLAFM